jgi:F0F1-type ATP synthase beta subunit
MKEELIGKIIHYYNNLGVGIIDLLTELKVGDKIHIKGGTTDFEQVVDSMQIDHEQVSEAKVGQSVGLKTIEQVREGDEVFLVT